MKDPMGKLTAYSMIAGAGFQYYAKAPLPWVSQGAVLGVASVFGSNMTAKNPENVYAQLFLNFLYLYNGTQEMYVRPKFVASIAPVVALTGLNMARCIYVLYKKDEPQRVI